MKVSVIIPVHDKAPFLRECLDSIFAQTRLPDEVIAVDDASTDDSGSLLDAYVHPRLKVVRLASNMGPGLAAQHAMDLAGGEFIVRMDADDVMLPNRIDNQIAFLEAHPDVDLCGSAAALLHSPSVQWRFPEEHDDVFAQLAFSVGVFQPTMVIRRAALQRTGLRYLPEWPYYGEDRLYQVEAVHRGLHMANLPKATVLYREGAQNTVQRRDKWADHCALHQQVLGRFGHRPLLSGELLVHSFGNRYFKEPPDAASVGAFRDWIRHLRDWNGQAGAFPAAAFDRRLRKAWEELYHHLPALGMSVLWAYFRAGGRLTPSRIYYAARVLLARGVLR
jgi:glycosyltransferase involved in cell wall biosynthesis